MTPGGGKFCNAWWYRNSRVGFIRKDKYNYHQITLAIAGVIFFLIPVL